MIIFSSTFDGVIEQVPAAGGDPIAVNERNRNLERSAIVLVQNWSRDIGR